MAENQDKTGMGRLDEVAAMTAAVRAVRFTRAQQRTIYGLLVERLTHRQIAAREGLTRAASIIRLQRARRKAKAHGVVIPSPPRRRERVSLAHQWILKK